MDVMEEMKRVHREIVQNIENKYISGLEDAMEALNKINEGKNKYKSEHLTYEENIHLSDILSDRLWDTDR